MVLGSNGATATTLIGKPRVTRVMYRFVAGSNAATATGGNAGGSRLAWDGCGTRRSWRGVRCRLVGQAAGPEGPARSARAGSGRAGRSSPPRGRTRDPDSIEKFLADAHRSRRHDSPRLRGRPRLPGTPPAVPRAALGSIVSRSDRLRPDLSPSRAADGRDLQRVRACGEQAVIV